MKALLLTSSLSGQTCKIMKTIADNMPILHYDIMDIHQKPIINWEDYQFVLIGASVRYGHYHKLLYRFIEKNYSVLNNKPSAFFGVNLVARKPHRASVTTNPYTIKLLQEIKWQPKQSAVFAGAVLWSKYKFWQKIIMIFIMKMTKGPTDTTQEIEYTDWEQVKSFAQSLFPDHTKT